MCARTSEASTSIMDPKYEELTRELVELTQRRKEEKDPMEKEKLKLQMDEVKQKRKALPKPETVVQAPTTDVMSEKQVPQKLMNVPEIHQGVRTVNTMIQSDKAPLYMAMGIKFVTRALGALLPYCDGSEQAIIMDDLIPACDNVVQDLKNKNVNMNAILNPYVALALTASGPVLTTAMMNYEKKTGRKLIDLPSMTSSTQSGIPLVGIVQSNASQPLQSTPSSSSSSSSLQSTQSKN